MSTNTRTYIHNFVRTPTKGLRLRLRTELRRRGVIGKFGTDEMRNKTLRVKGDVSDKSLTEFENRKVFYVPKSV
jgi:hypothetical protein